MDLELSLVIDGEIRDALLQDDHDVDISEP
jgi:hypothetical protein